MTLPCAMSEGEQPLQQPEVPAVQAEAQVEPVASTSEERCVRRHRGGKRAATLRAAARPVRASGAVPRRQAAEARRAACTRGFAAPRPLRLRVQEPLSGAACAARLRATSARSPLAGCISAHSAVGRARTREHDARRAAASPRTPLTLGASPHLQASSARAAARGRCGAVSRTTAAADAAVKASRRRRWRAACCHGCRRRARSGSALLASSQVGFAALQDCGEHARRRVVRPRLGARAEPGATGAAACAGGPALRREGYVRAHSACLRVTRNATPDARPFCSKPSPKTKRAASTSKTPSRALAPLPGLKATAPPQATRTPSPPSSPPAREAHARR